MFGGDKKFDGSDHFAYCKDGDRKAYMGEGKIRTGLLSR